MDLLHLKYKNGIYIKQDILMKIISRYEWKLSMAELKKFKIGKFDSGMYSTNFNNNCWCIICQPNGCTAYKIAGRFIKLKLLKLPFGIKEIDIK